MGDRMDNIQPGAMPWLHRYVGNPVLTGILNLFFRTGVATPTAACARSAATCCRGWTCARPGMEFASEMVIRAAKEKLDIRAVPDRVPPARRRVEAVELPRRLAPPALPARPQPDAPVHHPGPMLAVLGALIMAIVAVRSRHLRAGVGHPHEIAGSMLVIVGTQIVGLGLCAHAYGTYFMGARDPWFDRMRARFRLEHGLCSAAPCAVGLSPATSASSWCGSARLRGPRQRRLALLAATLMILGMQVFFTSFLLSILGLRRDRQPTVAAGGIRRTSPGGVGARRRLLCSPAMSSPPRVTVTGDRRRGRDVRPRRRCGRRGRRAQGVVHDDLGGAPSTERPSASAVR